MASGSSFESESLSATSHEADVLSTLDESHEDEEGSSSFSEVAPDPVLSLLSKLKSPRPSDLARKRRVAANPPKASVLVVVLQLLSLRVLRPIRE